MAFVVTFPNLHCKQQCFENEELGILIWQARKVLSRTANSLFFSDKLQRHSF